MNKNDFKYLSQGIDNNVLDLVKQKGFYPYECMSDFEKFNEKSSSKERFYSSLTNRKINNKEYKHVLNVWNKFEMETMKDYCNLYLKWGVLLLVDVFEKLRNNSLKIIHYLSAPGLSWDAILKMTKLSLNLFQILTCLYFLKKV